MFKILNSTNKYLLATKQHKHNEHKHWNSITVNKTLCQGCNKPNPYIPNTANTVYTQTANATQQISQVLYKWIEAKMFRIPLLT